MGGLGQRDLGPARALEQSGDVDGAVRAYMDAGSVQDAVRVLRGAGREVEAGRLIMRALGVGPSEVGALSGAKRGAARVAADCFAAGGKRGLAADILLALGEIEEARKLGVSLVDDQPKSSAPEDAPLAAPSSPPGPPDPTPQPRSSPAPRGRDSGRPAATRPPSTPAEEKSSGRARDPGRSTPPRGREKASRPGGADALTDLPQDRIGRRAAGWKDAGRSSAAHDQMIKELVAAGRHSAAARVMWDAGRFHEASQYFLKEEMHYEAGMCLADAGELRPALDQLLKVHFSHKRYRKASVRAIELSVELGRFDFDVDRFVSRFAASAPQGKSEIKAYMALASSYERSGFTDSAFRIYDAILAIDPDHEQARARYSVTAPVHSSMPPAGPVVTAVDLPDLPDLDNWIAGGASTVPRKRGGSMPAPGRPSQRLGGASSSAPPSSSRPAPAAARPAPHSQPAPAPAAPAPQQPDSSAALERPAPAQSSRVPGAPSQRPPPPSGGSARPRAPSAGLIPMPGAVIANRYKLIEELGKGGMATIFRALDTELNQEIALKLMHQFLPSGDWLDRFRRELALARKLSHKNIVRVFDIGAHSGVKFISMELLEGQALDEMVEGPIQLSVGIHYMVQACAGLRAAHDTGVVHRDIKPANMFVTRSGLLKLMDFGVARGEHDTRLTQAGVLVGTPDYMAPEQIEDSQKATALSDLYSLGVSMYQLFTGRLPFMEKSLMALIRAHSVTVPERPRDHNPGLPEAIDHLIMHLLAKEPSKRPQSATEVARELRAVARDMR